MPGAARCGAPPDHPEDPPRVRDGRRHRPGEHFRVHLRHTPRTELIKGGTTGIRHQDFCHARGDAMPYLQLHAQRNGVHLATRHGTFAALTPQDLAAFDLLVGADICFWEDLVDPLYQLIRHSVAAGVAEILVADPSRPPFDELCARCVPQGDAEVFTWTMTTPVADTGRILRVVGRGAAARRAGHHAGAALDCTRS